MPWCVMNSRAAAVAALIASWDTEPHYEPEQGEQTWPLANGKFVVDEFYS